MLQMGLMWLKLAENPELSLFIMWEVCVFFGQLLALQEGGAIGWMTKESLINFWHRKVFCCFQSIQKTSRGAQLAACSVQTQGRSARSGSKSVISV